MKLAIRIRGSSPTVREGFVPFAGSVAGPKPSLTVGLLPRSCEVLSTEKQTNSLLYDLSCGRHVGITDVKIGGNFLHVVVILERFH